jgi:hypothetical protein
MFQDLCTCGIFGDACLYSLVQGIVPKLMRNEALYACSNHGIDEANLQLKVTTRHGANNEVLPGKDVLQGLGREVGLFVLYGIRRDMGR